jgi:hypothetical protein
MLNPSDSPAPPQALQQGLSLPEGGRERTERGKTESVSIWRWISVRELVFVFAACSIGAALFQARDNVRFVQAWTRDLDTSSYQNKKYPLEHETVPNPIITDLSSDGSSGKESSDYN